jgi:MFS superfamily sulfate permease-like transporter
VTTLSAGKTYSAKYGYHLDPNQELIALGVTNIWGGIFQCLPSSSSLPRVALMDTSGGKTQVNLKMTATLNNMLEL